MMARMGGDEDGGAGVGTGVVAVRGGSTSFPLARGHVDAVDLAGHGFRANDFLPSPIAPGVWQMVVEHGSSE